MIVKVELFQVVYYFPPKSLGQQVKKKSTLLHKCIQITPFSQGEITSLNQLTQYILWSP